MTTIDFNLIKKDVLGDKKDIYYAEFPEIKDKIDALVAKPACGTCINGFFKGLYEHPKFEAKMKLIYGNDIKLTKNIDNNPRQMAQEYITEHVDLDKWDEWFATNAVSDTTQQVRLMTTFYVPETKKVVASRIVIKPR